MTWRSAFVGKRFVYICVIIVIVGCVLFVDRMYYRNHSVYNNYSSPTDYMLEVSTVNAALYPRVRVLCWIMTTPANHDTKVRTVRQTWAKRCNKYIFITSAVAGTTLPEDMIALEGVVEGREWLWEKTKRASQYVYHKYGHEYDWFLKADDDTYVIVENLRYLLLPYKRSSPVYFGCEYTPYGGYMSGGAGYVLSHEALRRFVNVALRNGTRCQLGDGTAEDVEMGTCLADVNVTAVDSLDGKREHRFNAVEPFSFLDDSVKRAEGYWVWDNLKYPMKEGLQCCSASTVTFHYITPSLMVILDYAVYKLNPYGVKGAIRMTEQQHGMLPEARRNGTYGQAVYTIVWRASLEDVNENVTFVDYRRPPVFIADDDKRLTHE